MCGGQPQPFDSRCSRLRLVYQHREGALYLTHLLDLLILCQLQQLPRLLLFWDHLNVFADGQRDQELRSVASRKRRPRQEVDILTIDTTAPPLTNEGLKFEENLENTLVETLTN